MSEILNLEQEKQHAKLEEKDNLLQEKTKIENEIKTLRDREISLQTNQAKLKAQVDVIVQSERNLAGFTEGSKILLEASAKGAIPGKIGPLTSRIRVKQEFEIAMAAVLGEMLEGILLEDSTSLEEILSVLEGGEKGKAVLISMYTDRVFNGHDFLDHPGILSTGLDALVADREIQEILKILLDQVYITRSRKDAREISRKLPTWGKVVTLLGEVFYGNGVVTAGRESRVNLLSRPREKQTLEKELEQTDLTHQKITDELRAFEENLEIVQQRIKAIENEIMGGEKFIQNQKTSWQQASMRKEQASQKLILVQDQFRNYQADLQRINSEIDLQKEESTKKDLELKQFRDETEATQELVKTITLDELQLQLTHWTTQVAVVEQNYLQTQKRITEKDETIRSLQQRIAEQTERIAGIEQQPPFHPKGYGGSAYPRTGIIKTYF